MGDRASNGIKQQIWNPALPSFGWGIKECARFPPGRLLFCRWLIAELITLSSTSSVFFRRTRLCSAQAESLDTAGRRVFVIFAPCYLPVVLNLHRRIRYFKRRLWSQYCSRIQWASASTGNCGTSASVGKFMCFLFSFFFGDSAQRWDCRKLVRL